MLFKASEEFGLQTNYIRYIRRSDALKEAEVLPT